MTISISRPEEFIGLIEIDNLARRNALGLADFLGLADAWRELGADTSIRCIVVTGAGDHAFCSGADLGADFSSVEDVDALVDAALLKTRLFPKPVIAAINGHCVAGGFELMLSADLRVVSVSAKLGLPEVRWGIIPSGGGAMKLIEQIGHARAMQLMLTAELISAGEALDMGLVNRVEPAERVLDAALGLARLIASNSPRAVQSTKLSALSLRASQWQSREPAEREMAQTMRTTEDCKEGRRAFFEKRAPGYV
ncbi:enoyl-CoA hydratase/isomerase family protein [Variovorax sp. VNK109]|uniref:enoyl-CoA hydratase/isomerase family protein n=1 Tax=Variovorax sp. VNK109 TaxID=3400919 RepID=UPI003C0AC8AE